MSPPLPLPLAAHASTPDPHTQAAHEAKSTASAAREKRIAEAVQRGKSEYKREHAFTERGWFLNIDTVAGPSKEDRQRTEFASTSRAQPWSTPSAAARALADILACAPPKPLSSLPREMLSTALCAAARAGDTAGGVRVAEACSGDWKSQPGMAVASAEAFAAAGRWRDATRPLLITTARGVMYPVLASLSVQLQNVIAHPTSPSPLSDTEVTALKAFASAVAVLAAQRSWAFTHPLFPDPNAEAKRDPYPALPEAEAAGIREELAGLDVQQLAGVLGVEVPVMENAVRVVGRGVAGREEAVVPEGREERGVKNL